MIIALAGRRVDAAGAKERRFSGTPESIELVRQRLGAAFESRRARVLVSSAACGADLLALSEAAKRQMRRRVILPFGREQFRASSVTDRPGDWGTLYDQVIDEIERNGDLVILAAGLGDEAYARTNHAIVDEALKLGQTPGVPVTAMLVWDGKSHGPGDLTEEFGVYARSNRVPVIEVSTI